MSSDGLPERELLLARWTRRAVTIPGLLVLFALDLALLPALAPFAAAWDVVRGRRFVALRFQIAVAFALAVHVLGVFLLLFAWVAGGRWAGADPDRQRRLDARIESWPARRTWSSAVRLFGMHVDVRGAEALDTGPVLLMSRHASLLDPLLAAVLARDGRALRYVIKRELLWDPCVDLLGHRLPNTFVRRGNRDHAHEIAHVIGLAESLRPSDVVVIFPEGTRFTPDKRERLLARLAREDGAALERASDLRNLLPPHHGGALGLLEHAPGADVVFCAHTGLEGANHLKHLARGSLLDATVHVRLWRVPRTQIPKTRDARAAWLEAWWKRMDLWIDGARIEREVASEAVDERRRPS